MTLPVVGAENGQIVAGIGGISQSGSTTTITQSSPQLSLTWNNFNIGANETVNFVQPSSSALAVNRIADPNATQILGRLNANGQVFLINPNGIVFGQGAQVDVGGIIASTLDLNDASLATHTKSFRDSGSAAGRIINHGSIRAADGGFVALLGNTVSNHGSIAAPGGTVALGAGKAATLTFSENRLVQLQVDEGVLNSLAENGGLIRADGGMVVMNAGAKNELLASVVNNTGMIQARRVENRGGTIVLLGGMKSGTVNVAGTLDASAETSGPGDGGFIETSGALVKVASDAKITTASDAGKGGQAGTWLIDPVDFTIAASGGDITGATLSTNLGSGNVVIQSTTGAAGTAGNVNVNDVVTWSANKLTLNAQNNILINANLNASSTASLALEFGQGAIAAGNTSNVITTGAAVNLPAGTTNFTTKKGSDGAVKAYTVITSLGPAGSVTGTDLQGMSGGLATNYALGANINAAATSSWNSGAGFLPVGNSGGGFTGTFEGLGHTITGLTINRGTGYIGLFGQTNAGSVVQNVGLFGGSVGGGGGNYVGTLVGNAGGTITNSYSNASMTSTGYYTGGLVGYNTGTITNSYANAAINGGTNTGGLVGRNDGTIQGSYAAGTLLGSNRLGGLVGVNTSVISNSYSAVAVTSNFFVQDLFGGLVGHNTGTITNSYASGAMVVNQNNAGGLVGFNQGTITNSYWNTQTTGQATSSGGTARTTAQMQQSANFTGWDFSNTWTIHAGISYPLLNSLMTPLTVTANNQIKTYNGVAHSGGNGVTYTTLINGIAPSGTLSFSGTSQGKTTVGTYLLTPGGLQSNQLYRITFVDGTLTINKAALTVTANNASRLYGQANPTFTTTISGFVNGESAGTAAGFGGSANATSTATTTTNAGSAAITADAGTLTATNYDFTNLVNGTLTIDKAHLTVTAGDASRLYGQANPGFTTTVSGFVNGENAGTAAGFSGTGAATSTATATTDVGGATITAGAGTLTATNYDFTNLVDGTLTIDRAHLTVTADDASRAYGQVNPNFTSTLSGFVNGENANTATGLSGTASVTSTATPTTNVGTATITAGAGTLSATNYDFSNFVNGTLTITKAALTATANASSKIYDGQSYSGGNGVSYVGFVNGESSGVLGGSLSYAGSSQGAKNAGSYVITPQGLTANNYDLTFVGGLLTIDRAALTAVASVASKTYDGNTSASVTIDSLSGLIAGETLTATAVGSFDSKNVGTNKTVGVTYTFGDGTALASNYNIASSGSLTGDITPKALTFSGSSVANKTYDGTTNATVNVGIISGLVSGETLAANATAAFTDKNVGTNKSVAVAYTLSDGVGLVSNYTAPTTSSLTADITPLGLTISGLTAANKVYDATNAANLGGKATIIALAGDVVSLGGSGRGLFADKNVGINKAITVSGFTLNGADAGNYSIVPPTHLTANISVANLAIGGVSAQNKIYDGTTTASLGGTATVSAFSGDSVSVSGRGIGTFADRNAGVRKSVTVSGFTLSGADAANYAAVQPTDLTANITAPDLKVIAALQPILAFNPFAQFNGNPHSSVAGVREATFDLRSAGKALDVEATPKSEGNRGEASPESRQRLGSGVIVIDGGTKLPANRVRLQN